MKNYYNYPKGQMSGWTTACESKSRVKMVRVVISRESLAIMSPLEQAIYAVLRSASGPIPAREILGKVDINDIQLVDIGNALYGDADDHRSLSRYVENVGRRPRRWRLVNIEV